MLSRKCCDSTIWGSGVLGGLGLGFRVWGLWLVMTKTMIAVNVVIINVDVAVVPAEAPSIA